MIPTAEMVRKVEVAVESRTSPDFLIIARTDARSSLGINEAIARGQAYAAAGADVVFVESPESEDEFARVVAEIDAPVLANMVEGGFSPVLSADRLAELGVTIGLFPVTALLAVPPNCRRSTGDSEPMASAPLQAPTCARSVTCTGSWVWTRFSSSRSAGTTDRYFASDQRSTTATSATNRTSGSGDQ